MTEPRILWDEFREGNDNAFSALFNLYSETLFRYGLKFGFDSDFVKDAIQDVFIHIYHHHNLPAVDNPKFYLLRSLKNNILNQVAKAKQMPTTSIEELPFVAEYELAMIESITDEQEKYDLEEKLQLIMEILPPRQKEALYLRFQLDMSYEEVSKMLNMNYQSTRNLIHRAIKNVRSHLELSMFISLLV